MVDEIWAEYDRFATQLKSEAIAKQNGIATAKLDLKVIVQTPAGHEKSPHFGQEWNFHLSEGDALPIGRSKGKKYVNSGMSLFKEASVSTNHGVVSFDF
jgi:hypothetical protein